MHICYKTNSQNPIKIYSSKKSLTVDPNTELDCSDFDINETIFVRSVFLKKEKRNIFGWFALFFGKLFVNIFNLIILNYPEHCFQYDDFTGFYFAFKCAISDVCIDYEQKQLKNRPEKYILVNGERKECIEIFDYDCFNNSVTKYWIDVATYWLYAILIITICFWHIWFSLYYMLIVFSVTVPFLIKFIWFLKKRFAIIKTYGTSM